MGQQKGPKPVDELGNLKLLRLIAEDELPGFTNALGLDSASASRDVLEKEVARFDPATVVDAILACRASSFEMLGDIFRVVERCGARIRTTGGTIVLPTGDGPVEHTFSKHAVGLIARFSAHWNYVTHTGALTALGAVVDSELLPWVRTALHSGRIRVSYAASRRVLGTFDRKTRVDDYTHRAVDAFTPLLGAAYDKVVAVLGSGGARPAPLDRIETSLKQLDALQVAWRAGGFADTNPHRNAPNPARHEYARAKLQRSKGLFKVLDTLARLADVLEPNAVTDLVQLSILKDRPRIFEVWVMMQLVDAYGDHGAALKLEAVDVTTDTWMLNFARSKSPVAKLTLDGEGYDLFYQRFEPPSMPDISLVKTSTGETRWVVDPKYSEKGGYALTSYVETARRYQKAFAPDHSIVAEYFPRLDIAKPNPWTIESKTYLVRDVRAGSSSYAWLVRTLLASMPPIDILAVDVSASHFGFAQQRASTGDATGQRLLLFFADAVETVHALLSAALGAYQPVGKSRVEPLAAHLETLHQSGRRIGAIELWSDCAFDDGDIASLEVRVRALGATLDVVRPS